MQSLPPPTAQPRPGANALRFELAGIPVAIQPSFWLGTILFGIESFQRAFQQAGSAEDARQAARAMVRGGQRARAAAWLGELAGRGVTAEGDPELESVLLGSGPRS